jgi:hypothetical protein
VCPSHCPCCSEEHEAASKSLTAALKAAGSSGSLAQLRSFTCMHVVPTEQLLQVRLVDCGEGSGS